MYSKGGGGSYSVLIFAIIILHVFSIGNIKNIFG